MPDPYILSLLAGRSSCFGHVVLPDEDCNQCDLKDACFKAYVRKATFPPVLNTVLDLPDFLPPSSSGGTEDETEDVNVLIDRMLKKEAEKKTANPKPRTIRFDDTTPVSIGSTTMVVDFESISSALTNFQKKTDLRSHLVDDFGKIDDYLVEDIVTE